MCHFLSFGLEIFGFLCYTGREEVGYKLLDKLELAEVKYVTECLIVSLSMFFIFSVGWILNFISSYRLNKQYDNFYKKYAVRKHAEILYYQQHIFRSENGFIYHVVLKFNDEDGGTYKVTLKTNHHSAKKYSKVKEDDFLCLYDVIKSDLLSFDYIDSKVPKKWRIRLHSIPLAVLPKEENFVNAGVKQNLTIILYVILFFIIGGVFLFIGEKLSSETVKTIYETASKIIVYIAGFIFLIRVFFSKFHKH